MLVQDRMTRDPVTISPDDTLASALELTRSRRIRHLPVVAGNQRLSGILSDRDIRLAMPSPLTAADAARIRFLQETPVAAVMTREVLTVLTTEPIENAAKLLYRHRIGALPVVDAGGQMHGIVTETDILHTFIQILGGMEQSSRIEIGLPDRPGELARAMHVIGEELDINISSINVPSIRGAERKTAIVHLATIDPRGAIRKLEAAGFAVGWPSLDAPVDAQ